MVGHSSAPPPPKLHLERATSPSCATNLPSTPTELKTRSDCSRGAPQQTSGSLGGTTIPCPLGHQPGAGCAAAALPQPALHRAPPASRGTCLSLLSCPVQWGWECSQPSDELNLPDRLDLPLVLRDAFTSSWLWQRQTCSDTLAVAQSHSPCVICFPLSLCRAQCEVCTDKPVLISSPCAPPCQGLHLCSSPR